MLSYRHLFPVIRLLPPEFAHGLALKAMRLPVRVVQTPADPFTWRGLTFRNRAGIAAGFDKNGECIDGVERLGVGFVEIGTVLTAPWAGNDVAPRMRRLVRQRALWNRLGFTSLGVEQVQRNLKRASEARSRGLVLLGNIGPHPGHLRKTSSRAEALEMTRQELETLAAELHVPCDGFVVNLSSPNTPGLRSLLQCAELVEAVLTPLRRRLRLLDESAGRATPTPMLVKLPPEDENREAWTAESLAGVVTPLVQADACDGFVAVNTSVRLARSMMPSAGESLPGGVSGEPLRTEAIRVVSLLRRLMGSDRLLIGCGGIMAPEHALAFVECGADLVELYSGLIFAGPTLPAQCAAVLQSARSRERSRLNP